MRLIDADNIKQNAYRSSDFGHSMIVDVQDIDNEETVDAVPVVRCKECRYADDYYCDGSIYCCIPGKPMRWHDDDPNWFCADGERKGGEKDE